MVAAKKDLLVVTRLGSLAEAMEARGVVVAGLGSRLYAVPLRGYFGGHEKMKSGDLGLKLGAM